MIHEGQFEIFDLTLTAKAPVFIGSGKNYAKKEYVFLPSDKTGLPQNQVILLDEIKFFHLLLGRRLVDKYERFMLGTKPDLYLFLTSECGLSLNDIRAVSRYNIFTTDAFNSLKDINAFVRGADGRVYIPGSSVKGALRTAILTELILSEAMPHHTLGDASEGFPEGKYLHTLALKKDEDGRTVNDAVNSIMRGISISDSLPVADSNMMLTQKTDASVNSETHQIPLYRECIRPETVLHFKLTLDQSVLHHKITAETLKKNIRTFDTYYETMFLRHFTAPSNAAAVSYTDTLLLGGGAGFFSKTLCYPYLGEEEGLSFAINELGRAFRNHRHEKDWKGGISPRTMKYALYQGQLYPYGLCEVSIS